jgi:hypothetical protein
MIISKIARGLHPLALYKKINELIKEFNDIDTIYLKKIDLSNQIEKYQADESDLNTAIAQNGNYRTKFVSVKILALLWGKIKDAFVQKQAGKGLSTNDFTDEYKNKLNAATNYALPIASEGVLGGVKIGANITKDPDGKISVTRDNVKNALGFLPAAPVTPVTYTLEKENDDIILKGSDLSCTSVRDNDTRYGPVSETAYGLMSPEDKVRLNSMQYGAQVNSIDRIKMDGVILEPVDATVNLDVYTKAQVDALVSGSHGSGGLKIEIVSSLPASGELGTIYLKNSSTPATDNLYSEYIWIGAKWEKLGDGTVTVDLSQYAKKTDIPTKVSQLTNDAPYLKKTEKAQSALTADKLANARSITLTGAVSGTCLFDGSGNVSINVPTVDATKLVGNITVPVQGSSESAEKLAHPREIKLTGAVKGSVSFDGTTDVSIPTAYPAIVTMPQSTFLTASPADADNNEQVATTRWVNKKLSTLSTSHAADADKLTTARKINGTFFDGTQDITTQSWGKGEVFRIDDFSGSNSGPAITVSGKSATGSILKLPATIKADLDGNVATATQLKNPLTLNINGHVKGSYTFTPGAGSAVTISTVLQDGAALPQNPVADDNSTKVATTKWVNDKLAGATQKTFVAATGTDTGKGGSLPDSPKLNNGKPHLFLSDGTWKQNAPFADKLTQYENYELSSIKTVQDFLNVLYNKCINYNVSKINGVGINQEFVNNFNDNVTTAKLSAGDATYVFYDGAAFFLTDPTTKKTWRLYGNKITEVFKDDSNNTISVFSGATQVANGTAGLVPAPTSSDYKFNKFLSSGGNWVNPRFDIVTDLATGGYEKYKSVKRTIESLSNNDSVRYKTYAFMFSGIPSINTFIDKINDNADEAIATATDNYDIAYFLVVDNAEANIPVYAWSIQRPWIQWKATVARGGNLSEFIRNEVYTFQEKKIIMNLTDISWNSTTKEYKFINANLKENGSEVFFDIGHNPTAEQLTSFKKADIVVKELKDGSVTLKCMSDVLPSSVPVRLTILP